MTPPEVLPAISPSARVVGATAKHSVARPYSSTRGEQVSTARRIADFLEFAEKRLAVAVRSRSQASGLPSILDELEELRSESEPRALENAKAYIIAAYRVMRESFPRPKMESDGEGGIVFDWRSDGKIIRLASRATPNQKNYIYYQFGDDHQAKNASLSLLIDRLNWLMQDA